MLNNSLLDDTHFQTKVKEEIIKIQTLQISYANKFERIQKAVKKIACNYGKEKMQIKRDKLFTLKNKAEEITNIIINTEKSLLQQGLLNTQEYSKNEKKKQHSF